MGTDRRTALVTGGAHGIGRAVVARLAADGLAVVSADLDPAAESAAVLALTCDVTDAASVDAAVAGAVDRLGRLDVLVTVAGGAHDHPLAEADDATWQRELDLNLTGAMRAVRAALPHLRRSPAAAVVLVSSVNGLAGFGNEPYSAAKAGLSSYARNLAIQLGPEGVRVNVVAPGTIATRVWDTQPGGAAAMLPAIPLGRVGAPADVAAAVAFLAGDDASWITGVTLPVDGGMLSGPAQLLRREADRPRTTDP